MRTAHCECVWMQHPAPRSKAARKRGVQADGLRTCHSNMFVSASRMLYGTVMFACKGVGTIILGTHTGGFRRYSLLL